MTINSSKSHTKRRIGLVTPLLLATAVALVIWMVATVSASYNPESEIILSSYDADEHADVTSNFSVPAGDVNFDAVATYLPADWGVALDADIEDGTVVGSLNAEATLGIALGTGTCSLPLQPVFTLYDATTEGASFSDFGDMVGGTWNGYDPACPGQGNGEKAVCEYPGFLEELFPVRPIARYYGHAEVGSGVEAALNFMVFEPGTDLGAGIPNDSDWGFITVTVLNDTGVDRPSAPSSLADFCSPVVSNNTVVGEADGVAVRTNPQYGETYTFRSWSRGQPDADGDGLENAFDTCPFDMNQGDPRLPGVDGGDSIPELPGDGLDGACDPDNAVFNADQDGDGYHNRADNCPLVANGLNEDDNQLDADNDGIGDSCDNEGNGPNSMDGVPPEFIHEEFVEISGPLRPEPGETATPTPTPTATPTPAGTGIATGTPTPTGTATPTTVAGEGCAPVIPGTYNGLVRLNGVPAAAGYEVTAVIDGTEWGSTIVSGGRYALDVPQKLPAAEPCFASGTITFMINGATCEPTEEWASGLHDVDLSCAAVATPTPPVVVPTTPPGTPPVTPVVTPAKPPVTGGGGLGSDQGIPLWALALASWAGLMALAGFGTVATRIIKR